jgi:hypothetical protein
MFNEVLNKYLEKCNAPAVVGIMYEQFEIAEKNGVYYIFENSKLINKANTLQQAKELINTINSGC